MGESSFGRGFGQGAGGVSGCIVALLVIFFVLPTVGCMVWCGFSLLVGSAVSVAAPDAPSVAEPRPTTSPEAATAPPVSSPDTDCGRSFDGRDALGNVRPANWSEWTCTVPFPVGACLRRREYTEGAGCPGRLRCCPPLVAP